MLNEIQWQEIDSDIQGLIENRAYKMEPLPAGLEAEVHKLSTENGEYVLKIWNKESRPNISRQYAQLYEMYKQGLAVSRPFGWGLNENHDQVLLMSYDGSPLKKVNKATMTELAHMLQNIHRYSENQAIEHIFPTYDFNSYFFPQIEALPDLQACLSELVAKANIRQNALIHGDYNLNNVVELGGTYTIIDWTNAQLGDPRYDVAWAKLLLHIYVSTSNAQSFRSPFSSELYHTDDEESVFEAIACLRWLFLYRTANLPVRANTISNVQKIIQQNNYLSNSLLD